MTGSRVQSFGSWVGRGLATMLVASPTVGCQPRSEEWMDPRSSTPGAGAGPATEAPEAGGASSGGSPSAAAAGGVGGILSLPAPSVIPVPDAPPPLAPSADCRVPSTGAQCVGAYCRIEPGCFIMGARPDEWFRAARSTDQVQVTLTRPFLLGKTEFTRAQWKGLGWELPVQYANPDNSGECEEGDECPINQVSFFDAVAAANRLSELEALPPCYDLSRCSGEVGRDLQCNQVSLTTVPVYECRGYRLPMEAEWEYASRAGTTTTLNRGDTVPVEDCEREQMAASHMAWYCWNSDGRPHGVARKLANGWGLHDMIGNVGEWCNDLYSASGYGPSPQIDPRGVLTPGAELITGDYPRRVFRGGYFSSGVYALQNSWHSPMPSHGFGMIIGFRLARTLFE